MYLPFGLAIPILFGGLLAHFYSRGKPEAEHDAILHRGVLFSSGVIAGEALTAVGIAVFAAFGVASVDLGLSAETITTLSVVSAVVAVIMFAALCKPHKN